MSQSHPPPSRGRPGPSVRIAVSEVFARSIAIIRSDPKIVGVMFIGGLLNAVPIIGSLLIELATGIAVSMADRTRRENPRGRPDIVGRLAYLVGAFIVATICIAIGLVLLVIPGIYLLVRFALYPAAVMVDGKGPLQALSESWDRTGGNGVTVFVFILVLFGGMFVVLIGVYLVMFGPRSPETIDQTALRLVTAVIITPLAAVRAAGLAVMYDAFER